VLTIAYDQEDPAEVLRARSCYTAVFGTMMEAGYIPYRVGLQSMADLDDGNDSYWRMVGRIKAALDPANIIAPGRYDGRHGQAAGPGGSI
jgi:4-cresol dehydrogenase (hydroxylating)